MTDIPPVPQHKITQEILDKVDAMLDILKGIQDKPIPLRMVQRYKKELRKLLGLQARAPIDPEDPRTREALIYIIVRKERTDKLKLRSAMDLDVLMEKTGELVSVEEYLKMLYPREGVNALSCYRALRAQCDMKRVLKQDGTPCKREDLPSNRSVTGYLHQWQEEYLFVKCARTRKLDWERDQQPHVTRDVTQFQPGEMWILDHTELDFLVYDEKGKLRRRWITAIIDFRTGLIVGYHLSWMPNSTTLALAFRNAVLGSQLHVCVKDGDRKKYEAAHLTSVPRELIVDNGKPEHSKYTQHIMGKIEFDDKARLAVQRITHLHYAESYHPQTKAPIERWFRTIQTMTKYAPGYKANQYQNKPDSLKGQIRRGEILRVDTFDKLMRLAVDVHNNRVKRTLKNQSPFECYYTNQTYERTVDPRVLDFLMMKVQNKPIRKCQVHILGADYCAMALQAFNDKYADVYYDPQDLGFVSVYVNGELASVASNKERMGQDERGWLKILRDRKRSFKEMKEEAKVCKRGVSDAEANIQLLLGEMMDTKTVSPELMNKSAPTMHILTGLERTAGRQQKELDAEKEMAEIERDNKKKTKESPITLAQVNKII
jgi:transposase InsO family protein